MRQTFPAGDCAPAASGTARTLRARLPRNVRRSIAVRLGLLIPLGSMAWQKARPGPRPGQATLPRPAGEPVQRARRQEWTGLTEPRVVQGAFARKASTELQRRPP